MANPFEIDWQKAESKTVSTELGELLYGQTDTPMRSAVQELREAGEDDLATFMEACGGPTPPPPRMLHLLIRPQELVTLFGSLQRKQAFAVLAIERGWGDDEITIPADVRVTCAHYDFSRDAFLIRCEHASFPEVEDGCVIPAYCVRLRAELVENLKPKE